MLKKRIVVCLDIKNGRTVKGTKFENMKDAGDPVELAKRYVAQGADELVFLDISATEERRKTTIALVEKISSEINIPFTVGGGISTLQDVRALIHAGADKVSINSSAVQRPALISDIAAEFGKQCVVLAIDAKFIEKKWRVFIGGGKIATGLAVIDWAKEGERSGAGEILLTSMDHDGTKQGFAVALTREVSGAVSIPVIASGGAGKEHHFVDILTEGNASAALAAGIFHFGDLSVPQLKTYLFNNAIPVRS